MFSALVLGAALNVAPVCHYQPADWYWNVGGKIYSSKSATYVASADAAWQARGCKVTNIASEVLLNDVLLHAVPKAALTRSFTTTEIVQTLLVVDGTATRAALGVDADAPANISATDARLLQLLQDLGFRTGTIVKG